MGTMIRIGYCAHGAHQHQTRDQHHSTGTDTNHIHITNAYAIYDVATH